MALLSDTLSHIKSKDRTIQSRLSFTLEDGSEVDVGPVKFSMAFEKVYEGIDYIAIMNEDKCSATFECFWNCMCWWCRLKRCMRRKK